MRIVKFCAIVLAVSMAANADLAVAQQQSNGGSSGDGANEVTSSTEVICRRMAPPTGSRIGPRRICKTQMEWNRIAREQRDVLENAQRRAYSSN